MIKTKCSKCGHLSPAHYYVGGENFDAPFCGSCLADEYIIQRKAVRRLTNRIRTLRTGDQTND